MKPADTCGSVLIVDDHTLFREGLASLLSSEPDFEVVGQAGSVREAILRAHQFRPDLVLMDFSLPDGSGVEASRAILAELPETKVVFLTVHQEDAILFDGIRSGARGYLLKNMPIKKLLAALRSVKRGEAALTREMTSRLVDEFSRTLPETIPDGKEKLSRRELEVLGEIATGATNSEIARHLFLSENTIKHYIHSILDKLGLSNRREAANYARRLGLDRLE